MDVVLERERLGRAKKGTHIGRQLQSSSFMTIIDDYTDA
jgi:hypothetical protein